LRGEVGRDASWCGLYAFVEYENCRLFVEKEMIYIYTVFCLFVMFSFALKPILELNLAVLSLIIMVAPMNGRREMLSLNGKTRICWIGGKGFTLTSSYLLFIYHLLFSHYGEFRCYNRRRNDINLGACVEGEG
jgi:hypothetical protein